MHITPVKPYIAPKLRLVLYLGHDPGLCRLYPLRYLFLYHRLKSVNPQYKDTKHFSIRLSPNTHVTSFFRIKALLKPLSTIPFNTVINIKQIPINPYSFGERRRLVSTNFQ